MPREASMTFEHYFIALWACEGKGYYVIFIVFLRNPICPFCPTDDDKYLLVENLTLTYTSEAGGPPLSHMVYWGEKGYWYCFIKAQVS